MKRFFLKPAFVVLAIDFRINCHWTCCIYCFHFTTKSGILKTKFDLYFYFDL